MVYSFHFLCAVCHLSKKGYVIKFKTLFLSYLLMINVCSRNIIVYQLGARE